MDINFDNMGREQTSFYQQDTMQNADLELDDLDQEEKEIQYNVPDFPTSDDEIIFIFTCDQEIVNKSQIRLIRHQIGHFEVVSGPGLIKLFQLNRADGKYALKYKLQMADIGHVLYLHVFYQYNYQTATKVFCVCSQIKCSNNLTTKLLQSKEKDVYWFKSLQIDDFRFVSTGQIGVTDT